MASSKKDCNQVDTEGDEPRCSSIHLRHGTSATRPFFRLGVDNASGQLTIDGNIPFSEVAGAWYQTNAYKWERLLVDSGGIQLVRSIKEPPKIATIVLSRGLPEHCSTRSAPEDNVPYYDEFVRDVGGVESMTGAMAYQSDLRNRLVTFIAEKYVPRETGRIICPACLTETPNNLSICIRCSGSLVSCGKEPPNRMEVYFLGYLNKRNQRVAMDPVTQKEILTWTKTRSIVW